MDYLAAVAPLLAPAWADPTEVLALLESMRQDSLNRPAIGEWLRSWLHIEGQADIIRWFESNVVPGPLQTESYARELLATDAEVSARLDRQHILSHASVTVVITESVLHQRVGPAEVMYEQLTALADSPAVIQVLPADTETYAHLDGPFVLATVGDRQYVYVDTAAEGFTLERREVGQVG